MSEMNLTAQHLRELLHYNSQTGNFTWIVSRGNQFTKPGMQAGFKDTYGHMGIEIDGRRYLSHRLAWLYVHGQWPNHQIDHINRIRDDNRIENLRDVTGVVNLNNKGNYRNNTTGFKGVTIKNGRFIAQITVNGKCKYLGSFDTAEKASQAYQNTQKKDPAFNGGVNYLTGEPSMIIPEPEVTITSLIDKAHEARLEKPRAHMGASTLGHHCERWMWLSFRWAVQEQFKGRILRVFRRGNNEEATIISDLRAIGMSVTGTQRQVDFGSHVSGSLDGIGKGVPSAAKTQHVLEFKTHSLKSFNDLEKNGVAKSKPQHFTQCQVYMHGTELKRALYIAVCKDDDRIYTERLEYDRDHALKAIAKGQRLALTDRLPPPISVDPTWFECKMCAGHDFCHGSKTTKEVNCRTCANSTPLSDSTWHCAKWDAIVPTDAQLTGCESHVLHPDLVPWKRLESPSDWVAVYEIDGLGLANGEPGEGVYGSKELLANAKACSIPMVNQLRTEWDGRVVR